MTSRVCNPTQDTTMTSLEQQIESIEREREQRLEKVIDQVNEAFDKQIKEAKQSHAIRSWKVPAPSEANTATFQIINQTCPTMTYSFHMCNVNVRRATQLLYNLENYMFESHYHVVPDMLVFDFTSNYSHKCKMKIMDRVAPIAHDIEFNCLKNMLVDLLFFLKRSKEPCV